MVTGETTLVRVGRHAVGGGSALLTAVGLGSCVAIIVHDSRARIGGMAHVLLPDTSTAVEVANPFKFATTAVPRLLDDLLDAGSTHANLEARLVGGASMFASLLAPSAQSMGDRNVQASREALRAAGIPLRAEDVGGEHGRTVRFDVGSGIVKVSSVNRDELIL